MKITPRDELKDDSIVQSKEDANREAVTHSVGKFTEGEGHATVKEEPKEKTITMTEVELRAMIKEVKAETEEEVLASASPQLGVGEWQEKKAGKNANKTARMRLYQVDTESPLGVVVDLKFFKNIREETVDGMQVVQYYKMTVMYDDSTEEDFEISLKDFSLIHDSETVEIIKTDETPFVRVLGKILKSHMKDKYSMSAHVTGGTTESFAGSTYVDQEEVKIQTTHTIKRPNGQTLELDNSKLNL